MSAPTSALHTIARVVTSTLYTVRGDSMSPSLTDADYVLVARRAYRRGGPARGDIVLLRDPRSRGGVYVKRVVGLPGEWVGFRDGHVLVNDGALHEPYVVEAAPAGSGVTWPLAADEYFVLGDNRSDSLDSRRFGPLRREHILGQVWYRLLPGARRGQV
jgi:signal peptidase I